MQGHDNYEASRGGQSDYFCYDVFRSMTQHDLMLKVKRQAHVTSPFGASYAWSA